MQLSNIKRRALDMVLLTILVLVVALPGLSGLPVIDRDEARYAQASVQMMESGDYVNIRFQDRARNKKPAGVYWAQVLSVKAFSNVESRDIWAHRIPSVLAAILAVLATYLGGIRMFGRDSAIIGAVLLATSMIFVFEAHIAKTDALLCAASASALAALGYMRNGGGRKSATVFWIALGCAVMIKGPIFPALLLLCFICLSIWEKNMRWMKPLGFWLGPILCLAIVLPWTILIWRETGGAFFTDAVGADLLPKLKGGQEKHGGLPGYYLLTSWIAFWPACLFLLPGLAFGIRAGRGKNGFDTPVARSARLLLCWSIPFFIMLELTPTKLPHYPLPIYPALALLAGVAIVAMTKLDTFKVSRRIGAVLFAGFSILLLTALLVAEAYYGQFPTWSFFVLGIAVLLTFYGTVKLWKGKIYPAFIAVTCAALATNILTYQFTMPSLQTMHISARVQKSLNANDIHLPSTQIFSPQFTEPSLVYRLGSHIKLGRAQERLNEINFEMNSIIILDRLRPETQSYEIQLMETLRKQHLCLENLNVIDGFNYAKGREVKLDLLRVMPCAQENVTNPATQLAKPTTTPDP